MITKPTLFILGAGASAPFGLPTGRTLRSDLCYDMGRQATVTDSSTEARVLLAQCGFSARDVLNFGSEFMMSSQPSIDAFLALRTEFDPIGKCAIAAELLPRETGKGIYVRDDGITKEWGDSDWYSYLWTRMMGASAADWKRNKVAFITFNYDRTLEVFLLNALRASYRLEADAAWEMLQEIPIHHVYGDLGEFRPGLGFGFDGKITAERVKHAADRLRIVPSTRPDEDQRCADLISLAKRIFFLGFGFDEMNCLRLGYRDAKSPEGLNFTAFGTAAGLKPNEISVIEARVTTSARRLHLDPVKCLDLLRNHSSLLT